jgi:hypothetical protein
MTSGLNASSRALRHVNLASRGVNMSLVDIAELG